MYIVLYEIDDRLWKEECEDLTQAQAFADGLAEEDIPSEIAQVIRQVMRSNAPIDLGTLYAVRPGRDYPETLGNGVPVRAA